MAKKPEFDVDQLRSALIKAGVVLFTERSGFPLNQAQRNLEGRTHYVDDSTVKSFAAKVHSVHVLEDGLILGMVESIQAGATAETGRVYRPVFFDVFGNIVFRPEIEDSFKTQKSAQAEFWKRADDIDPVKATLEGVEKKHDSVKEELKSWEKLMDLFS
jgi:hypothetical protein